MVDRGADEKAEKCTQGCKNQANHVHPVHPRQIAHAREEFHEAFAARFIVSQRIIR